MTKLKLLSAALITTAMIAAPAMAQKSRLTSRLLAEEAHARTTPGARNSEVRDCQLAPRVVHLPHGPRRTAPLANLRWVTDPSRAANRLGCPMLPATNPNRYRSWPGANATPLEQVGLKMLSARLRLWPGEPLSI